MIKKLWNKLFNKRPKISQVVGYSIEKTMHTTPNMPTRIMIVDPGVLYMKGKNDHVEPVYIGKSIKNDEPVVNNKFNRLLVKIGLIKLKIDGVIYTVDELHEKFGQGSPIEEIKNNLK